MDLAGSTAAPATADSTRAPNRAPRSIERGTVTLVSSLRSSRFKTQLPFLIGRYIYIFGLLPQNLSENTDDLASRCDTVDLRELRLSGTKAISAVAAARS